jgi:DNA-binding response OmpR family regulator
MKKVLWVEDDVEDIELMETAFKTRGVSFETTIITNGDDAIRYITSITKKPDLIILDVNLPRVQGLEILKVIRDTRVVKEVPVLVMTTSRREADISVVSDFGGKYRSKPVTIPEFNEVVDTIKEMLDMNPRSCIVL